MIDNNDWLIKPENYRTLQKIRKRIRSIYGDDIRITSAADVESLFRYRHDKDSTLARMLEELEHRVAGSLGFPLAANTKAAGATPRKMYRGQVVPG